MGYLHLRMFSKHGHFGQDQILRTIWCGPNTLMDVFDSKKFQGLFGMDRRFSWMCGQLSIVLKVHEVDSIWSSSHLLFFPPIHSTNKRFKNSKLELTILLPKIFQWSSITLRLKSKIFNIFVRAQCDLDLDCHFILCHASLGHQAQVPLPPLSSTNVPYSFHVLHICCSLPRMVLFCLFIWKTTTQSLNVSFNAPSSGRTSLMFLYWVRFTDIWSLEPLQKCADCTLPIVHRTLSC